MKLFEMKKVPEKVGDAIISFTNASATPVRRKGEIILPDNPDMDFFSLNNGLQFLVCFYKTLADEGSDYERKMSPQCWFGGMDESPFLVRLHPNCYYVLIKGGEQSFFESLKPKGIRHMEKIIGQSSHRQGDIFGIEILFTLKQLKTANIVMGGELPVPEYKDAEFSVFGTRHRAKCILSSTKDGYSEKIVVKDAILEAPDHRDLKLPNIHFLEQAANLYAPVTAD